MAPDDPDLDPTSAATQVLICRLAKLKGWQPSQIERVLREAQAPLEGFYTALLTGDLLIRMADDELDQARRAQFGGTGNGSKSHFTFDDFDPENKEGELRGKWSDTRRKNYRLLLEGSRRAYAGASQFQTLIASGAPPTFAEAVDENDEDAVLERRRSEELSRRLSAFVAASNDKVERKDKREVKRRSKHGLAWIGDRTAKMEAEETQEE